MPSLQRVRAEIVTYDERLSQINPLFFVQLVLLLSQLVVFVAAHLALLNVYAMPWLEFSIPWGIVTLLLFLVQWSFYRSWERACRVQRPSRDEYERDITYKIGMSMVSEVQRGTTASSLLFFLEIYVVTTFMAFSDDFVIAVDHSVQVPSLLLMTMLSFLAMVAFTGSLVAQYWPLANITEITTSVVDR